MVSDPAWFPSAAMQTIGVMYTIFVAVYVLVLQKMVIQKEPTLHRLANSCFILLSFIVGITIILNATVVFGLGSPYCGYGDFFLYGLFFHICALNYLHPWFHYIFINKNSTRINPLQY